MKRIWNNPVVNVQQFVPQEYCGACQSASDGLYKHTAHCLNNVHAYIFYDNNGTPGIQDSENLSLYSGSHGGCNLTHTWYDNSPTVTPNAVIVIESQRNTYLDLVDGQGSGYSDNVYKLKSQYVNTTVGINSSTTNTANGPTWAVVIDNGHSQSGTWIVSPNMQSWKTVVS